MRYSSTMAKKILVAIVCLLFPAVTARAGDPKQQLSVLDDGVMTISARVDEVKLFLTVTDSRGRFVAGLTKEDLHLLDNHQPPERVNYFQAHTHLPLRVTLLTSAVLFESVSPLSSKPPMPS